jgi:regulator of sigma E protease
MQILITIALIIIGILLFELIIFSHEFGHYITAKKSGVKVNEFSLGMGPRLFGFKKGETEYTFRLFPIGGFCAMEGEDEDSLEPRAFNNAKIWKRMIIIIAGAVMNIILGFVLMFAYTVQADSFASTTIDGFYPNSVSANCGLQVGDQITEINGYSVWNSRDLQFGLATMTCSEVDGKSLKIYKQDCASKACSTYVQIYNDNEDLDENTIDELYTILTEACSKINAAQSKEEAYSYLSDVCYTMNDKVYDMSTLDYDDPQIEERDTRLRYTSDVKVIRDGKEVVLEDVQFYTYYADEEAEKEGTTSISIDFAVTSIDKNIGSVLSETFSETCSMVKTVWTSLVWLVQGRFSFADLSGPVGIASAVTTVASQGLETSFLSAVNNILFVMILITVNLGIVNMLPFPALDGGRFLFLLIEWIFRKPIPRKAEQIVNAVGLALLMVFMLIISVKDVWQLVTGNMPF